MTIGTSMPAPPTEIENQRISFFDLPTELRVMVYEHFSSIFKAGGKPRVLSLKGLRTRYDYFSRYQLPLLLTSKRIRDEVQDPFAKSSPILQNNILHLVTWDLPPADSAQGGGSGPVDAFPEHLLVQRLKITVEVPFWWFKAGVVEKHLGRKLVDGERLWSVTDMNWLYPVRKTKEWTEQTGGLELLRVEICHPHRWRGTWDQIEKGRALKDRTESKIETLSIAPREVEVTFTVEDED